MVFKLWSHRDYIYGYLQKIIIRRSVFMMCVSSWRLFFKVNRSNLSVESVCFSMLQWSELTNHCRIPCWDISRKCSFYDYYFLLFSLPTCVQVSRCGDVYNTNNSCCSVLFFFLYCFQCFFFETCALLCDFWSDYNTVDGYVLYKGISLFFHFAILLDISVWKRCCRPHEMWHIRKPV